MDKTIDISKVNKGVIDVTACATKLGIKEHQAYVLLTAFIGTLAEEVAALRAAHESGCTTTFVTAIHRFNGALHYIGLPALRDTAVTAEYAAKESQSLAELTPLYQSILNQIRLVETEYLKLNLPPTFASEQPAITP